jgi:hypothetical protein
MTLREMVRTRRVERSLTSDALGVLAGVPGARIRSLELGYRIPREACVAIATALGITVTEEQLRKGR